MLLLLTPIRASDIAFSLRHPPFSLSAHLIKPINPLPKQFPPLPSSLPSPPPPCLSLPNSQLPTTPLKLLRMSPDCGERRTVRPPSLPEPEHFPCPRCESTNTKFCYYNNYNLSQPRHFCKACRRYWTQGGTLRNIPFGGGTRKSAKRSRTSSTLTSALPSSSAASYSYSSKSATGPDPPVPIPVSGVANLNDHSLCGSFTSLLSSQLACPAFLSVDGFEPGIGLGDMGFGLGRRNWPYYESGGENGGGGAWQMSGAESGLADADSYGWPDLAISMPGEGLKQ